MAEEALERNEFEEVIGDVEEPIEEDVADGSEPEPADGDEPAETNEAPEEPSDFVEEPVVEAKEKGKKSKKRK